MSRNPWATPRVRPFTRTVRRGIAGPAAPVTALVTALITALAGCAGSAPTRYHALAAVPTTAISPYDGPPIELGAVQVPPALAREELVRDAGDGPFQVREFDHWAAPLGRLARQALTEDLTARLPPGKVVFPGAAWPTPGALLTVDVLSFKTDAGSATMVLSWSVRSTDPAAAGAASAPATTARGAQLRLQTPAGDGAEATARAWSQLLGQLADQVATQLAGGAAAR